jgi:putative serine protease PepD
MEIQRGIPFRLGLQWGKAAAAVVVTAAVAAVANGWMTEAAMQHQLASQEAQVSDLRHELESQPNWPAIVVLVERSVVTVEAGDDLGSGWVAHADAGGSDIVTNFHVVADSWNEGVATVTVRQGDRSLGGTIARVDPQEDLAIVHVAAQLPALVAVTQRLDVGSAVMAAGSPLGLDGTVTVGVISSYRSLEGNEYVQFSAAVSPGNSGGPLVDQRGRVIGIVSAKLVYPGAEGLSLAIPVAAVCSSLVTCATTASGR